MAHAAGGEHAGRKHLSAMAYVATWAGLLVLTTATFLISRFARGGWEMVSALGFAAVKAGLVAAIFMHLYEARFATRLVFLVSIAFVALLVLGALADVSFRLPLEVKPPGAR